MKTAVYWPDEDTLNSNKPLTVVIDIMMLGLKGILSL